MSTSRVVIFGLAVVAVILAAQLLKQTPVPSESPLAVEPRAAPVAPRAERAVEPAPPRAEDTIAERVPEPPAAGDRAAPAAARADSRRFVFDCGNGVIFAVRTVPGEATLSSPQALGAEVVTVPQVDAASGARYAAEGVSFWSRGGLARFEIRERTFADCTSNPGAAQTAEALRRGVSVRAQGRAPPWLLEISQERIELALVLERDTRRIDFPYREPTVSGPRTTYRSFSGTQELNVVIDRTPCNDATTGERFDTTVTVTFENRIFYGCGQPP